MKEEAVLFPGPYEYKAEHLGPISIEFDAAIDGGHVPIKLAKRYMRELDKYAEQILDTPGGPGWVSASTTDYEAALRRGAEQELAWIDAERTRILDQTGGYLAVDALSVGALCEKGDRK